MPLQATSGAASYDAFGGGVPVTPVYIEDVMSVWLYTGTSASQTITNGIDLAGSGGLTWFKNRNNTQSHYLIDSARGISKVLSSNATFGQGTDATIVTSYNSNGFTVEGADVNASTYTYASWTFRKSPKFFDVVTYTGNGVTGRQIPHNLGSAPGCMFVKRTSTTGSWWVYHRSLGATKYMILNATDAEATASSVWNDTPPTSTDFTVGDGSPANTNGVQYVAYLFAHNAGGFGLTGTDNVISCGSYATNASGVGPNVNLGYEPQWILAKVANGTGNWELLDTMRGWTADGTSFPLKPNTSGAEAGPFTGTIKIDATGFQDLGYLAASRTIIYIAIRRGPMKVPTTGTSVFAPVAQSSRGTVTTGFPVDLSISKLRALDDPSNVIDRLRGNTRYLQTTNTDAEGTYGSSFSFGFDNNTGFVDTFYNSGFSNIYWNFRRAPGFFDEVCYTGTGSTPQVVLHNLQVAPQLIINKSRSATGDWHVYAEPLGNGLQVRLNVPFAAVGTSRWGDTNPTATQFTIGAGNTSGVTFVAYLFASAPGVSKVGGYTGTGTTQVINCGFTTGARFVLIKRTDSDTGDWFVWDSARGIVAGNDPYLLLNSTAAEVTNTDYVDTAATGFEISSTAPAAINASGGSFIFLAVA